MVEDPRPRLQVIADLQTRAEMFEKAAARAAADPTRQHNVEPMLQLARARRAAIAILESSPTQEPQA